MHRLERHDQTGLCRSLRPILHLGHVSLLIETREHRLLRQLGELAPLRGVAAVAAHARQNHKPRYIYPDLAASLL